MATLDIKAEFLLGLNAQEMRLIRAALAGKLKPEDVDAAKTLGMELARRQATVTASYLKGSQHLLENIEKAGG